MILQQKAQFDSPLVYLYVGLYVLVALCSHGRAPKPLPYHLRLSARRSAIFGPAAVPYCPLPAGLG